MRVGFTGTRSGMSERQKEALKRIIGRLLSSTSDVFNHGDCIGADDQAHDITEEWSNCWIHIFPALNPEYRAGNSAHLIEEPEKSLDRDRKIVEHSDLLIAAPYSMTEEVRSGTWSTVRMARKKGIPVIVLDR